MPRKAMIQHRAGTLAEWAEAEASGPALLAGERAYITDLKLDVVGDGVTKVASLGAVGSGTYAAKGRESVAVYQDFTGLPNGSISGMVPAVGPAFITTGAQPPTVTSGAAVSTGTGYIFALTGAGAPAMMWAETAFTGDPTVGTMTMAASTDTDTSITNALHFNYSARGFSVTVRQDAGTFDSIPGGTGRWIREIPQDGVTAPRIMFSVNGATMTVIGPSGEVFSFNDPRIAVVAGGNVFWEPNQSSAKAYLLRCGMVSSAATGPLGTALSPGDLAGSWNVDQDGRLVGNRGTAFEVAIGRNTTTGLPAIEWGPRYPYSAMLTAQAAAAATSIVTDRYIPNGSTVMLESGTNSETVTAGANSTGTGPYTTTVSALTKTHAARTAAIVAVPAGYRTSLELFTGSLRALGNMILNGTHFYFAGQTAHITQASSGVVAVGGTGTGKGGFISGKTTTAARPAASAVPSGTQMYDTDLAIPIWSNGTVWKNAAGTTV